MSTSDRAILKHHPVVCPHCWHDFHDDEAWYISRHTELQGDAVIADPEAFKRFGPHEVKVERSGVVKDSMGLEMTERACPRCHLQIPVEMLERRPFFVSVAGAPSAGKTYFLTSMLHTLGLQMARSFKIKFSYCDRHDVRAFKDYDKQLFRGSANEETELPKTQKEMNTNVVALDGMRQVFLPKPFMFRFVPTHDHPAVAQGKAVADANFVFYDNAGEAFDPDEGLHRQAEYRTTQHLKESSGVMFVYDPLQDGHVRDRLAGSQDPQVTVQPKDCAQEAMLGNLIDQIRTFRGLSGRDRIDVPLAICVQKFDAWRALLPPWAKIDDTSVEYLKQHAIAALDVGELSRNSLIVRQLLEDVAPQFVSLAESSFSVVRYFPVSALGTHPKVGSVPVDGKLPLLVRRGDIHPVRVTDPLLWFLSRWKLIPFAVSRSQAGTAASVVAANRDRMTVQFPGSGIRMSLDWEYSGMTVVDPVDGTLVAIPKVERPAPTAPPLPSDRGPRPGEGPTPPPRKKGLSLDNPEERKKKGGLWNG